MLNVVIELVVSFAQYFSTIVNIPEVGFPDSWKVPIQYVATINIGLDTFQSYFPSLRDIRVYFMFLSVVGPLVFVVAGLLFLNEKRVVLWYLLVVFGIVVTLAGALGRIVAATTDLEITADTAQLMLYAGIADLVVMTVIFLINKRLSKDDDDHVIQKAKLVDEETKSINVFSTLQAFFLMMIGGGFAVLCWGIGTDVVEDEIDKVNDSFAKGLSGVGLLFGFVFFLWFILGLSQAGRKKQWAFQSWFETGFLRVMLLSVSLAYIPIGSGVFLMFNCNQFSCPAGSRLPDDGSSIWANSTSLSSNDYCVTCQPASNQLCPSSLLNSMCVGSSGLRLEYAIETQCENVRSFFWPAAGIIIIMFIFGVPAMFFSLINTSSSVLAKEFPIKDIKRPDGDADFDEEAAKWHKQVQQSQNVAKFLYQPFQYRFRFVRLFQILQKLLIVATTSYVIRNTQESPQNIALYCSLIIHSASFFLLAYHRPFLSLFEARIAVLMSLSLTSSCVIAILLALGVTIPSVVMYVVIALNGALPCVAIVIGLYLEWSSGKQDNEEKEKEEMMKLAEEVNKKLEEEREREEQAAAALDSTVTVTSGGEGPLCSSYPALDLDASRSQRPPGGSLVPKPKETAEERRRRQLRRLRMQQEAKMKVKDDLEKAALRLNDAQGDVDLHIDRAVKSKLQLFMMIGGVLGAISLSLCLLGIITRQSTTVLEPFPSVKTTTTELAGYGSWSSFVSSCCCTQNTNPDRGGSYRLIEKWICVNGAIKERVRQVLTANNATIDGFSVRSYCGTSFAGDCGLSVGANQTVAIQCTTARTANELRLW